MRKGSFISREESTMLQGIAVMLMVFHHLFGFPERINVPFRMVFDFELFHAETVLSYFGRICISIFAFVSGYGLGKLECNSLKDGYQIVIRRLKKFYIRLWMVCVVFIPIGYVLKVYELDGITLVKSILGISAIYNREWWYIATYLQFLMLYPFFCILMNWFYRKVEKHRIVATGIIVILLSIGYICLTEKGFICWLLCFVMGMLIVKSSFFEKIYTFVEKSGICKYAFSMVCIISVFLIRTIFNLNCSYDYLLTPILVFSIVMLLKSKWCKKCANRFFLLVGKYSTYIWLTHTFFAYYYFQMLIYGVKYSVVIFLWCLLCCILTGIVLEYIVQVIEKKIFMKR